MPATSRHPRVERPGVARGDVLADVHPRMAAAEGSEPRRVPRSSTVMFTGTDTTDERPHGVRGLGC